MSGFKPVHNAHAIERVSTRIQFAQPLNETDFKKIREVASTFADDLPRQAEIQAVMLSFGPPGGPPDPPFPEGFLLQNMERDGSVSSELRVETASITYRTDIYTRWRDVWLKAKEYFGILIPEFLNHSKIVSINLTYADKFVWDEEILECKPGSLLRNDSEYICSHVYDSSELWHTHTGKFLRIDNKFKRLLNLNIDCLDEKQVSGNDRRVVKILTVITDSLNQAGYATVDIASDTVVNFIDEHMSELHTFSKNTLGKVICDDMCRRIGLFE